MKAGYYTGLLLCFLLAGCTSGTIDVTETTAPEAPKVVTGEQGGQDVETLGVASEELQFVLGEVSPTFEETENVLEVPDVQEPIYVERDGYAYELDSTTLEVIDVPLDLVTKEPVETAQSESGSDDIEAPVMPDIFEPADEFTKLPNMGVYLEDD